MRNKIFVLAFVCSFFVSAACYAFAPTPNYCAASFSSHTLSYSGGPSGSIKYSAGAKCTTGQIKDCSACAELYVYYIGENSGSVLLIYDYWNPNLQCNKSNSTSRSVSATEVLNAIALHVPPDQRTENDYITTSWIGMIGCVEEQTQFHDMLDSPVPQ